MTIQYTPEKRDYVRASRTLSIKSPWFLTVAAIILLAMAGSAVVLVLPGLGGETIRNIAPIVLVVGLVYLLYYFLLIPIQLSRAFKSNEHLRMPRILTFLDSHLRMGIGEQSVDLPWGDLQKVIDGGDYILLIFKGDQQVYPFIPKRAIEGESTRRAMFEFFRAKSIQVL